MPSGARRGADTPMVMQVGLNWVPAEEQALREAHEQRRCRVLGSEVTAELRSPEDFDGATRLVRPEDIRQCVLASSDLDRHAAWLREYIDLGFEELHLHQVGRPRSGRVHGRLRHERAPKPATAHGPGALRR